MSARPPTGLYIHVPFCVRRCLYCDFYVLPLGNGPPSERIRDFRTLRHRGFLRALNRELAALPEDFRPETVYIGGGTPTELPPQDLQTLFDSLQRHLNLTRLREFTCEANPGTLDRQMADLLVQNGIDRVSLGVQHFDDHTLETLGRIHDAAQARQAVADLRSAGIANLGIDLLFALPLSEDLTHINLAAVAELQPEHVSWYSLEFEPGTAFTDMRDRGFLHEPDQDQVADEYDRICGGLADLGYLQYELFSFCRPGRECRHNLNYWQGGGYHGCGPSAHRHVHGLRSANRADLTAYLAGDATETEAPLSSTAKARERLVTSLRLTRGIHLDTFARETGHSPHALLGPLREVWIREGWIEETEDTLRLLPPAYLISDHLFRELV